jgi:hypothetical protein
MPDPAPVTTAALSRNLPFVPGVGWPICEGSAGTRWKRDTRRE